MNYLSLSGGADSTALAIYLAERREEFEMVFADTGAELPETYWILPRIAKALGRTLHIVNGPGFFRRLYERGFLLPGFRIRWCTRELKEKPLNAFFKEGDSVLLGIRADEDHRARRPHNAPKGVEYSFPLVEAGFDKKAVLALCESRGLLNPCYTWRTNTSCFCCPFQRKQDWRNLCERHPDLYALAEDWEAWTIESSKNTKLTWNDGFSLKQLREADEAQVKLYPECHEEPCTICQI